MKITALKLTKRNKIDIYADNKYILTLSLEVILKSKLKVGSEISEETLNQIIHRAEFYKAKEKALKILSYRAHSCGELRNKIKNEFSQECVDLVIDDLKKLGFLNDKKFSMDYIEHLYKNKGYAFKRIKYELKNKMIDSELASQVLSTLKLDELSNLERIIEKKKFKDLKDEKSKKRAISYLIRLGYSWGQLNQFIKK